MKNSILYFVFAMLLTTAGQVNGASTYNVDVPINPNQAATPDTRICESTCLRNNGTRRGKVVSVLPPKSPNFSRLVICRCN